MIRKRPRATNRVQEREIMICPPDIPAEAADEGLQTGEGNHPDLVLIVVHQLARRTIPENAPAACQRNAHQRIKKISKNVVLYVEKNALQMPRKHCFAAVNKL